MSNLVLKIIACITMFIDHLRFINHELNIPCIYVGRFAFPIFAFLISQGYIHTKNKKLYLGRLFAFAIISQLPAYFLFTPNFFYLNVYFTLALGLLCILLVDKMHSKYLSYILVFAIAILAEVLGCDYGAIGVLMILTFYLTRNNKLYTSIAESILIIVSFSRKFVSYALTYNNIIYFSIQLVCTILSLSIIALYNGKRGKYNKKVKMFFYWFYPVHLTVFCILKYFLL